MSVEGVSASAASLKDNKWTDYAMRFAFGGAITALAGWTGKHYGPVIAGLLLAFPAIFPASATLLADHEKAKKRRIGKDGAKRGRQAAAVDAEGAALGCAGLAAFALVVWRLLPGHSLLLSLLMASVAWFVVAVACWELRRKL